MAGVGVMSCAVSDADTPETVTVWVLEDQPEEVRVTATEVGALEST